MIQGLKRSNWDNTIGHFSLLESTLFQEHHMILSYEMDG